MKLKMVPVAALALLGLSRVMPSQLKPHKEGPPTRHQGRRECERRLRQMKKEG